MKPKQSWFSDGGDKKTFPGGSWDLTLLYRNY